MLNKTEILKNAKKITKNKDDLKKLEDYLEKNLKPASYFGKSIYLQSTVSRKKNKVLTWIAKWEKDVLDKKKIKDVSLEHEQIDGETL
jgi:hypothetical protein